VLGAPLALSALAPPDASAPPDANAPPVEGIPPTPGPPPVSAPLEAPPAELAAPPLSLAETIAGLGAGLGSLTLTFSTGMGSALGCSESAYTTVLSGGVAFGGAQA